MSDVQGLPGVVVSAHIAAAPPAPPAAGAGVAGLPGEAEGGSSHFREQDWVRPLTSGSRRCLLLPRGPLTGSESWSGLTGG